MTLTLASSSATTLSSTLPYCSLISLQFWRGSGGVVRNPSLGNWVTVIGMMGDRTVCCWWVTILVMVGDHPRDGWRLSLSRWVIVLGMVGDHPGDYGWLSWGWWLSTSILGTAGVRSGESWWPSLIWRCWVKVLWMVGDHPGDSGWPSRGWEDFSQQFNGAITMTFDFRQHLK